MENVKAKNKMAAISLILPVILLIGLLLLFLESVVLADKVYIGLLWIIDLGFLVAIFLAIRTKQVGIIVLSSISNGLFFIALTMYCLLMMFALGFSEP
ncbi:hypothetical protein ACQKL5_13515 [Peribacillus sp. NPDC097675]|uniref:hypothetical protein n=1 Tax=Peribacillus sp. NPDC097675 TaxID=3390618 RepID=UPI003D00B031